MVPKVNGNGLIGASGYSHILAISHQPMEELVDPDTVLHSDLYENYSSTTGQIQIQRFVIF
jgi:hypothetical protein